MVDVISVRPEDSLWRVECEAPGFPRTFPSGAAAEEAAIRSAEDRAAGGAPTEVRLFLRDGSLAGRFVVWAPAARLPLPLPLPLHLTGGAA